MNRLQGERGKCKADATAHLFRHRVEWGDELELIPSHLFYLAGCDLRCKFCIAEENAFDPQRGAPLTKDQFGQALEWGRSQGARNLQWVGGEPTIHLPIIFEVMAAQIMLPPIVWKSDFYGTREAFALLSDIVNVYVADFKFGNDACARRIAGVDNYLAVVTRNLLLAQAQGDLIVRHLLLPGHFDCCYRPIVGWMRSHLLQAKFSIRDGYLPKWQAHHTPELNRLLPQGVGTHAREVAAAASLNVIV